MLVENNRFVTDPEAKANILANHLEHIFKCSDRLRSNNKYLISVAMSLNEDLQIDSYNQTINLHELNMALSTQKSTSPGDDFIHNDMLKQLPLDYKIFLLQIFNYSLDFTLIPPKWKLAIVLPFLKEGKASMDVKSYRPISLLSCVCKLLEKIILNRVSLLIESKKKLRPSQGGFRKRLCTVDQITNLENDIRNALLNKKILVVIFIDLEKAFDSVWHLGLIYKIQNLGIRGKLLRWMKEYLSNRKFKVLFEGKYSSERNIGSGVPQGAILSPLFFNIMMSDLPIENKIKSAEYADDICFYCVSDNTEEIELSLQAQLVSFAKWTHEWGLNINPAKTKAMMFTKKRVNPPSLNINNSPIEYVQTHRYLGMVLDSPKLSWNNHIEYLKYSSVQRVNVMRAISGYHWGADRKILSIIYKSLVRSRFDYGCSLYDTASYGQTSKLDKIQNRCLRIITGAQATSPVLSLEVESNFPPLQIHRNFCSLKFLYRIIELPLHVSIGKTVADCIQMLRIRPIIATGTNAPAIIRAINLNSKLELQTINHNSVPLISPLRPSLGIQNYFSTEFSNIPVKDLTESIANQIFRCIDSQYESSVKIYTDGSKITDPNKSCGAAVVVVRQETTEMLNFRLAPQCSIMSCELYAISQALDYIKTYDGTERSFIIYTDSMSSIELLAGHKNKSNLTYIYRIYQQINDLTRTGIFLKIHFVPGHKNIEGNELADLAANAAHALDDIGNQVSKEDRVSSMRNVLFLYWEKKWVNLVEVTNKGKSLKGIKDKVGHWPWALNQERTVETVMARLRIGHANFKEHLYRFNLSPTPFCDCGNNESLEHLMMHCPITNRHRIVLRFSLNQLKVPFTLKNILGGGDFDYDVQLKIVEIVAKYLKKINKLHIL